MIHCNNLFLIFIIHQVGQSVFMHQYVSKFGCEWENGYDMQ